MRQELPLRLAFLLLVSFCITVESKCSKGCDLALASYSVWDGTNLTFIAQALASDLVNPSDINFREILSYNPNITDKDFLPALTRVNVPFPCDCVGGEFLGHTFRYNVSRGNTYNEVATKFYSNLTTSEWLQRFNSYPANNIPDQNAVLNVTVNCSCGDADVSSDYGLFVTYPLRPGETLDSVARETGLDSSLLQRYNRQVNRSNDIVYVPGKDKNGAYPILKPSNKGIGGGAIAGIVVAIVAAVLLIGGCAYLFLYRKKKSQESELLSTSQDLFEKPAHAPAVPAGHVSPSITGVTVDKSVEFSYEELSVATNNFSMANKIGQGGFGAVYYAELRGEKAAIKKMDMQASREFLAELKVLTNVHHVNLVRLIGYCVEGSLFLVYEYIENGNLTEHLRGSGRDPLPWHSRVQIALDSARGLEYIHEHTVPVYIHRDIKSANILIDKNFRGKVADFGLTKLTEVGGATTRLVGTFGYMPPEYAGFGEVSPKVDVYAFGVVLYELVSAKGAIMRSSDTGAESRGLVAMFEEVLDQPDPEDGIRRLVDPRLGDNYPFDAVFKMTQLAKECTLETPHLRPSMRSIVVALMTLSSSTDDWDVRAFNENQSLVKLMSGR